MAGSALTLHAPGYLPFFFFFKFESRRVICRLRSHSFHVVGCAPSLEWNPSRDGGSKTVHISIVVECGRNSEGGVETLDNISCLKTGVHRPELDQIRKGRAVSFLRGVGM